MKKITYFYQLNITFWCQRSTFDQHAKLGGLCFIKFFNNQLDDEMLTINFTSGYQMNLYVFCNHPRRRKPIMIPCFAARRTDTLGVEHAIGVSLSVVQCTVTTD